MDRNIRKTRMAKTYFDSENVNGFVPSPVIDKKTNCYRYYGVEVFTTENKGLGLRATQNLSPGCLIPFGGLFRRDETCIENAFKNSGKNDYTRYLIVSQFNKDGKAVAWLDAHDRLYNMGVKKAKFAWIGSLVNEPGMGEFCNSELVWIEGLKRPKYPYMCKNMNVFLQVLTTVRVGDEILVDYQYSKTSYKKLNYLPSKFLIDKNVVYNTVTRTKRKLDYNTLNKDGSLIYIN